MAKISKKYLNNKTFNELKITTTERIDTLSNIIGDENSGIVKDLNYTKDTLLTYNVLNYKDKSVDLDFGFIINYILTLTKDIANNGGVATIYIPSGKYNINTRIIIDHRVNIVCDGLLVAPTLEQPIYIKEVQNSKIQLNIDGGESRISSNFINSKEQIGIEDSNGNTNLRSVIYMYACMGIELDTIITNFPDSRAIECISCKYCLWSNQLIQNVGQGIFFYQKQSDPSASGSLGSIYIRSETTGSYFNGKDIRIGYYENVINGVAGVTNGVIFENCSSLWINNILAGPYSGGDSNYMFEFIKCNNANINNLYVCGNYPQSVRTNGVFIQECTNCDFNLNTQTCYPNAICVNGLLSSTISLLDNNSYNVGIIDTSNNMSVNGVNINVHTRSTINNGLIVKNTNSDKIMRLKLLYRSTYPSNVDETLIIENSNSNDNIILAEGTIYNKLSVNSESCVENNIAYNSSFNAISSANYPIDTQYVNKIIKKNRRIKGMCKINCTNSTNIVANAGLCTLPDKKIKLWSDIDVPIIIMYKDTNGNIKTCKGYINKTSNANAYGGYMAVIRTYEEIVSPSEMYIDIDYIV